MGQRVLTAATGAASGDVGGSLGGLVQGAAATLAQGWATERVKSLVGNDDEHPLLRALAQGAVACAGSVAGGAGSCGGAALGAATSVGLHELLKTGATPAVDADGNALTQAEAQRRDTIVATVVGVTAGMLGLDPGAAVTGAKVEGENNSLRGRDGKVVQAQSWQLKDGLPALLQKDDVKAKLEQLAKGPPYKGDVEKLYADYANYAACATSAARTCSNDPLFDQVASALVDASGSPPSALLDSIGQHVAEIVGPSTLANMANAPGAELAATHNSDIALALERDSALRQPGLEQEAAIIGLATGAGIALAMGAREPKALVLSTPIHTPELGDIGTNAVDPDDRSRGQYEAFPSFTPQVQLPGLTPDLSSSIALPGYGSTTPVESGSILTADDSSWSARQRYMGSTPDKFSRTGAAVLERMRGEGLIIGEGPLLRGNPNDLHLLTDEGPIRIDSAIDMAHRVDAVTWWNEKGRFSGAKSPDVRKFMLDPDNYVFQPGSINRSEGARLGTTYEHPSQADAQQGKSK